MTVRKITEMMISWALVLLLLLSSLRAPAPARLHGSLNVSAVCAGTQDM